MPYFERGFTTSSASAGAAYADIRTSSTVPISILEIGMAIAAGTNTEPGLIRSATVGTASTSYTPEKANPATAAAASSLSSAWSSVPTIAGTPLYLRQGYIGGTVGNGLIWTWDEDQLIVPVSSSILIWNYGAAQGAAMRVWFTWKE